MKQEFSVSGLYYNYKKTSEADIKNHLKKIRIVHLTNKGIGSVQGYYPLNDEALTKIVEKPRNISLTFDATTTSDEPLMDLTEYKTITYLVKSSSRFFLKPDIGEIFDQINIDDLWGDKIKAICFNNEYELLSGTEGEHFLMTATLLIDKQTTSKT